MSVTSPGFHQRLHDRLFKAVHTRNLIYNLCWEDPRLDRQVLEIDQHSDVVMLTSAGCNALDYLLDAPRSIHCVDVNPRQNALLELKRALFKGGDFIRLWSLMGEGADCRYTSAYREVRDHLPAYAVDFWDRRAHFFAPTGRRRSFYYRGTSGLVAWVITRYLRRPGKGIGDALDGLLDADSLDTQREIYARVEPELWGRFSAWLLRQPMTLALLGVPRPQIQLMTRDSDDGVLGYVRNRLRQVFTQVPFKDNYFWRVYLTGRFTPECCPNYLLPDHFETLRARVDRLHLHTTTLSGFLKANPATYSQYVLLDHQDWLAWNDPAGLAEEWDLILANSRPGTRIILRSAGMTTDFIPPSARARLRFFPELTERLHARDRVGTYGSFHLAQVQA